MDIPQDHTFPALTQLYISVDSGWGLQLEKILRRIEPSTLREVALEVVDFETTMSFLAQCDSLEKLDLRGGDSNFPLLDTGLEVMVPHITFDDIECFRQLCPLFANTITSVDISFSSNRCPDTASSTMPTFPLLTSVTASVYADDTIRFLTELLSLSPNITTLSCIPSPPFSDPLLSALSRFFTKYQFTTHTGYFASDIAISASLRHLSVDFFKEGAKVAPATPSYLRSILDNQALLNVNIRLGIPPVAPSYAECIQEALQSLSGDYHDRLNFI